MSDINFDCPHCGKNLEVEDRGAGMSVPCPTCGKEICIPTLHKPQVTSLKAIPRTKGKWKRPLVAVGGVIVLGVVFVCVGLRNRTEPAGDSAVLELPKKTPTDSATADKLRQDVFGATTTGVTSKQTETLAPPPNAFAETSKAAVSLPGSNQMVTPDRKWMTCVIKPSDQTTVFAQGYFPREADQFEKLVNDIATAWLALPQTNGFVQHPIELPSGTYVVSNYNPKAPLQPSKIAGTAQPPPSSTATPSPSGKEASETKNQEPNTSQAVAENRPAATKASTSPAPPQQRVVLPPVAPAPPRVAEPPSVGRYANWQVLLSGGGRSKDLERAWRAAEARRPIGAAREDPSRKVVGYVGGLPLHAMFDAELASLGGSLALIPGELVVWTYTFPWQAFAEDGTRLTLSAGMTFYWVGREDGKCVVRDRKGIQYSVSQPQLERGLLFKLKTTGLVGAPKNIVINRLGYPTRTKSGSRGEFFEYVKSVTYSKRQFTQMLSTMTGDGTFTMTGNVGNQNVNIAGNQRLYANQVTTVPHDYVITYNPYAFAVYFTDQEKVERIDDLCQGPAVWVNQQ